MRKLTLIIFLASSYFSQGMAAAQQSIEQLTRGCNLGNAASCTSLGFLYDRGDGVTQSFPRAAELYEQGCEGGDGLGCMGLGLLYETGQGVAQNHVRAQELFQRGCDGGVEIACNALD